MGFHYSKMETINNLVTEKIPKELLQDLRDNWDYLPEDTIRILNILGIKREDLESGI